jgi:hypothetical protein
MQQSTLMKKETIIKMKPNLHCIEGGVGKHLQFTALFEELVNKYNHQLVISSGYPELFNFCPQVADSRFRNDSFLDSCQPFYSKYDNIFFHDPYRSSFLKGETHVVEEWANQYEISVNDLRPSFDINKRKEKMLLPHIKGLNDFILLQFTGGQGIEGNTYDFSNAGRNYNHGQELIYLLKEKFPAHIIIIFSHSNEREEFVGETKFNDQEGVPLFKTREDFMILAKHCSFFIAIDSALHHMGSNRQFGKRGIILWGATSPHRFGYKENINLQSEYPYCVQISPEKIMDKTDDIK